MTNDIFVCSEVTIRDFDRLFSFDSYFQISQTIK